MNIVGKTLVIINLVFALLVAGFLVLDFATRTNWKTGFEKLKGELDVSRANTKTAQDTNVKLLDDKKTAEANLNVLQKEFKKYELEKEDKLQKAENKAVEEAKKAESEQFKSQRILSENDRLHLEVKDLTELVKKRDTMVRDLQDASNKYRQEALANQQRADSANQRSLALVERVRVLELEAARKEVLGKAGAAPSTSSPRSPDYRNPPAAYVKGVVEALDPRDPLVAQISLGSDEGLKEDQTLDVFRLSPHPDYIGTLRLTNVNHHTAVGKLLPSSGGAQRKTLKVGDEVASRIIR